MGPSLLAGGALLILSVAGPAFATTTFNYSGPPQTGAVQTFTIPTTGLYLIVAYGASGAGDPYDSDSGGLGAEIGDTFNLTAGDVLQIDVGGSAGNGEYAGGGGGGTFVVDTTSSTILAIAGGGGGGVLSLQGFDSTGIGGTGAGGSGSGYGGGGGGYFSSGGGGGVVGGGGYPGLAGAVGGDGPGGFGGGGGAGYYGGGGGGGYSGGAGGSYGTSGSGGTSYDGISNSSPMIFVAGENSGDGSADITALPEPASFAMLLTGLAGLLALRRRAR